MGHRLRLKSGKIKAMVEKPNKMTETHRGALRAQCLRTDCTGGRAGGSAIFECRPWHCSSETTQKRQRKKRTCTTLKNNYYKKSKSSQV
ncbi:hypothetical protein H8958_006618, partial [Nasalis larvatus]